jgi:hypothetical protein
LIVALPDRALTPSSSQFVPPAKLAQHVTSSINLDAYAKLPKHQQEALYTYGAGSKTRVAVFKNILAALGGPTIDATTVGRNRAAMTVKTPIEAMLAAENAWGIQGAAAVNEAMTQAAHPEAAKVGAGEANRHAIGDLQGSVAAIQDRGAFPTTQGEAGSGYLAVSEKLQPPLLDPENNQLRVLVEHRGSDLVNAVNEILAGRKAPDLWREFEAAVRAMDAAR